MKEYKKICIICGEEFIANSHSAKLCSKECIRARARQLYGKKPVVEKPEMPEKPKKTEPQVYEYNHMESMSLAQMNAAARERGMSYGKYVEYLECEKRRKEREERKRRNEWD